MPERLKKDLFRDAALQIYAFKAHGSCEKACIVGCIEAIGLLIKEGENLREQNLKVMDYVDAALRQIYPGLGKVDAKELKTLLAEEKEILEKIRDGKQVSGAACDQVSRFCQDMWYQLGLAEQGHRPHRSEISEE